MRKTEPEKREERRRQILSDLGVPFRFLKATLDHFKGEARENIGYAAYEGALLYGNTGTGKTHAAAAAFREAAESDFHWHGHQLAMLFITVPRWLYDLRASFATQRPPARPLETVCNTSFLVLDDVGVEKTTDWTQETLYVVISHREANLLPTIVTTNLSLTDLDAWNPRLASRLAGFRRIPMEGEDRRLTPPA